MFKKILVAEDHENANLSVQRTVEDLGISQVEHSFYCDDAFGKIQKAIRLGVPYELLITDLSFEDDDCPQNIKSGADLIKAIKVIQPEIRIIVFSAEKKEGVISQLFNESGINSYVHKGRSDIKELKKAIEHTYKNEKYISPENQQAIRKMNAYEFSSFDIQIIKLLSDGILQKNIPEHLQKMNIKPQSLSSVEKRLSNLKESLDFSNYEQLVVFCKDLGII